MIKKQFPAPPVLLLCALISSFSFTALVAQSVSGAFAVSAAQSPDRIPGDLIAAGKGRFVRGAALSRLMRFANLPVLGLGIDTKFLAGQGYAQWQEHIPDRMRDVVGTAINYHSEGVLGLPEIQSGMLFLPSDYRNMSHPLTWIVYTKGTELKRTDVPSLYAGAESKIGATIASLGYAVWMPDYPGMGIAPGVQTYCDPGSLARSTLDGLAAARSFIGQPRLESGRLYVMGYSEGGLAAMAVARAISEGSSWIETGSSAFPANLAFSGVYAMGAPLDLTPGYSGKMGMNSRLSNPAYTLLVIAGYARAHPSRVDMVRIVRADIRKSVIPLLGTNKTTDDISRMIAKLRKKPAGNLTAADIFEPEFIASLALDHQSDPFFQVLSDARLDSWTPARDLPITLAATRKDKVVPFENSSSALSRFSAASPEGSAAIRLMELASDSHDKAAVEALLFAIMDIDRKETAFMHSFGSPSGARLTASVSADRERERQ